MIKLEHVSKIYKSGSENFAALDDVSLEIKPGEFVAILGPSGSGKSTLMHLIGGLDKPSHGTISVFDHELGKMSGSRLADFRNKRIGFVFQFFNLINGHSAHDNVALPLIYGKGDIDDPGKRINDLLSEVGLTHKKKNKPNQLSGGEQQRVAIARALVNNPDILLADEPTGNLDSKNGEAIMKIFNNLHKEGKTIILVTHDKDIAAHAKRVIRVKDGKLS